MSRIGRTPVAIPQGVSVEVQGGVLYVRGPKGALKLKMQPGVRVRLEGQQAIVEAEGKEKSAMHGLIRSLLANMVHGTSVGYEKRLEIIGVGYKAQVKGRTLNLSIGFSHPVDVPMTEGIEIAQDEKNKNILVIRGIDKQEVGQMAATIRAFRPPEPYKGKGIRYIDEFVRRKVGKAAAAKTAA